MKKLAVIAFLISTMILQMGMGRDPGQYDEEARAIERMEKEQTSSEKKERHMAKTFASGLKQATVDNTTDVLSDTVDGTKEDAPIVGTLDGARKSTGKVLDNTVKGAAKVATLGYVDEPRYEFEEPEKGSGDTSKIKFKF